MVFVLIRKLVHHKNSRNAPAAASVWPELYCVLHGRLHLNYIRYLIIKYVLCSRKIELN